MHNQGRVKNPGGPLSALKKEPRVLAEDYTCPGCRKALKQGTPVIALEQGLSREAACSEGCVETATRVMKFTRVQGQKSPKFR